MLNPLLNPMMNTMANPMMNPMMHKMMHPDLENDKKHDDKPVKIERQSRLSKSAEILGGLSLRGISSKEVSTLLWSPLQAYTVFLMTGSTLYYYLGGDMSNSSIMDKIGILSTMMEGYGLLSLSVKIKEQGSVSGISGMTILMYALTYTIREVEMLFTDHTVLYTLNGLSLEVLQITSLLITYSVVYAVFSTYRKSYQEDLDVLKFQYLVPACLAFALVVHPTFCMSSFWFTYCWTIMFYIDVMALAPQVVMMAKGGGTVEAPISHFVAVTAFSRSCHLWYWYYRFDTLGAQGYWFGVNYSGWLIVLFHVLNLLFVADFMYYYMKARMSGSKLSADLAIPMDAV